MRYRFTIEVSDDGQTWKTIVDRSNSYKDNPNAYIVLNKPVNALFVRYNNVEIPGNNLALSEIRVFGKGFGKIPAKVKDFLVTREEDRRDATLSWKAVKSAQGYTIRWGIAPDKLYRSWLLYEVNKHFMRCLNRDTQYYFSIEAFTENGISEKSEILKID